MSRYPASRYAAFRQWVLSQVLNGASPRQVARWLRTYQARFPEEAQPLAPEISAYSSCDRWDDVPLVGLPKNSRPLDYGPNAKLR